MSAEGTGAQTKVNIIYPGAVGAWIVPLVVAKEQGLFSKNGLDVGLVAVSGATVPRLTGEVPLGYIGGPAALLQAVGGANLKILGSFDTARLSGEIVARPGITKPEELRGRRFGVRVIGAAQWIHTILALEHLGLDLTRDNISTLAVGDEPQIVRALVTGAIDAAVLSQAQSRQLKAKGFSVLFDLSFANVYGAPSALAVTATYVNQHPNVVEQVLIALVEATAFSLSPTNKSTILNTIMRLFDLGDPAAAERTYQNLTGLSRKPYAALERFKSVQKVMAIHDPKVLDVNVEELLEDRFVRKLDDSGTIDRLYSSYGLK
jgi:ABC-type nitrate/sulfonate/bicarbonate transport system substrate-binding protein